MTPTTFRAILIAIINKIMFAHALLGNRSDQSLLLEQLLDNYGPRSVRPVKDITHSVHISYRFSPVELINFDEEHQLVHLSAYSRMIWTDENMVWDPADYGGVDYVTVKRTDVWLPDIVLYENVVKDFVSMADTYIHVNNEGLMDWYFPIVLTAACPIDITYFPYDVQTCKLQFGPWTLTSDHVNLTLSREADASMSLFHRNGVWVLEKIDAANDIVHSCCYDLSWTKVDYTMYIRRESGFYTKTVVVPCILLTALMSLVCWLHPASGEKVTLAVSNLLALILFQQLVADRMPPSGETTSIIVNFFIVMIGLSCTEVIFSIIVLRMYHTGGRKRLPDCLRRFMLSRFVQPLYTNRGTIHTLKRSRKTKESAKDSAHRVHMSHIKSVSESDTLERSAPYVANGDHENAGKTRPHVTTSSDEPQLSEEEEDPEEVAMMWQEVAIVCDKFLFAVLLLVTFVAWLYVLTSFLLMF